MIQDDGDSQSKILSGQVTDPNGDAVPDATIRLYPSGAGADATPLEVVSNDTGEYSFNQLADKTTRDEYIISPDESVLIATFDDWFSTISANLENQLDSQYNITLQDELLFGPANAKSKAGLNTSLITCWRSISSDKRQILYFEIVDLNPYSAQADYDILPGSVESDITSGTFLISMLREKANINFGSQSNVGTTETPPAQVLALPKREEYSELVNWHPLRTGLPLNDIGSGFVPVSSTDPDKIDQTERITEGIGLLAGGLPVIGTAMSILDAIEFAIGDSLETQASVGDLDTGFPDPDNPDDVVNLPDPNTHVTAPLGWDLSVEAFSSTSAGSVVMLAPIEFNEGVNEVDVTAYAEWLQPAAETPDSFGQDSDIHVTFKTSFELSVFESISDSDSHPSGVSNNVWDAVTGQNDPTDELTYDDLVDSIQAYQNDESVNGVTLTQDQLQALKSYYGGGI